MTDNSPRSALRSGWRIYREKGVRRAAREGAFYSYESVLRAFHRATGRASKGTNVFAEEWDVLIVLDACRVDLLDEVAAEYDFVDGIDTRWSVGSASVEWMENTFTEEYREATANTIYVTGNPFTDSHVDEDDFAELHELWRSHWDDEVGTVRPRVLTDRAIDRWRSTEDRRMIVHYMQPHYPFLDSSLPGKGLSAERWGDVNETNVWYQLRDGKVDADEVWDAYRENLRIVMDEVELFLDSVDAAPVVLTADHGNGVGEWYVYGHPRGVCIRPLREVPWVTTEAVRVRDYEPELHPVTDDDPTVSDRLEALGYR